jgi:tetrapyrrole methylase family protein/MazG family protein
VTILIIGLGPGDLRDLAEEARELLADPARVVLVRTLEHPAARQLVGLRPVESGDQIYQSSPDLDIVYRRLAERVVELGRSGPVAYAVPGSPRVGERSVELVRRLAAEAGLEVRIVGGASFLDLVLDRLGLDPLDRGLQVLDGRNLPDPLLLHLPTVIAQVDRPMVLGEVRDALGRLLPDETPITLLADLGTGVEVVETFTLGELDRRSAGPRTTLYLDGQPAGWSGLVATVRRLRRDCPWDASQTHHSLVRHLIEEAYEVAEAIGALPAEAPAGEPDHAAYLELEAELGDLLLQAVFHANLAREAGVFDAEEMAEQIRRKLVRRHPHVFGEVQVEGPEEVIRNWERLKQEEKGRQSLMDDVPAGLPALARAAKLQRRASSVGFDWPKAGPVLDKLAEEVEELREALDDPREAESELGDVLFAVVNLSRHLHVDPEMALRRAVDRFADRFRAMERSGPLDGLTLEELDARWEAAKGEP